MAAPKAHPPFSSLSRTWVTDASPRRHQARVGAPIPALASPVLPPRPRSIWRSAAPRCFTAPHGADDGVAPLLLGGVTLTHANDAVPSRLCSELSPSRPPSGRIGSVRLPRPASESGHDFC